MARKLSEAYSEIGDYFTTTIDAIIKDVSIECKEILPIKKDGYVSTSNIPYLCPREEAIALMDGFVRTWVTSDSLRLIFETGNAFQDIIRDLVANRGILFGMWRCHTCDYVHGSTDGEFTVNSRGAKEAILNARINRPHVCGIEIDGYGVCDGDKFEYIEDTIVDDHLRIKGHPDGYIQNAVYDHVWELKTTNDYRYKQAKKEPFHEHLEQAMWYAFKASKKGILLTYFNKNTGEYFTHEAGVDQGILSNINNRVRETWRAVNEFYELGEINVLPDKICHSIKDTRAKKCELCERCFSLDL